MRAYDWTFNAVFMVWGIEKDGYKEVMQGILMIE